MDNETKRKVAKQYETQADELDALAVTYWKYSGWQDTAREAQDKASRLRLQAIALLETISN